MRAPPFPSAIGAALCAHAAVASALALLPRPRSALSSTRSIPQELVFVTEEPSSPEPSPTAGPTPPVSVSAPTRAAAPRGPLGSAALERTVPADDAPESRTEVPRPAGSNEPWSLAQQASPVDLGVGSYWKSAAREGSPRGGQQADESRAPLPSAERMVRDALAARDHELGVGPAAPLVSAAHEAASPAFAPDVGTATFEVEVDGAGKVLTAQLVSFGADTSAWNDVAREIVRAMASPSRTLHLPPGARGLRARLRITAERTLPSGTRLTQSPGAVPDDVPGGDTGCVGTGMERKCLAGSPLGGTSTIGDLSNIGAKRSRVVHVELLSELTL